MAPKAGGAAVKAAAAAQRGKRKGVPDIGDQASTKKVQFVDQPHWMSEVLFSRQPQRGKRKGVPDIGDQPSTKKVQTHQIAVPNSEIPLHRCMRGKGVPDIGYQAPTQKVHNPESCRLRRVTEQSTLRTSACME